MMFPFYKHSVPEDDKEEKRMALRARNYSIINEDLYRGGVCALVLKCISRDEGRQLLEEIHNACALHISGQGLWQARHSDKVFIGPLQYLMRTKWCEDAQIVSGMLHIASFPQARFNCYLWSSHWHDGASTLLAPYRRHQEITSMQQLQWSTSPNGSKPSHSEI